MVAAKILIADDEPHIREVMASAITRAGYVAIEAGTAREAMEKLREEHPDVTLLDLGLPDRDGLELLPLMRRESETTLIVVSARDAVEEKIAALDLGADDYIAKPFDTDELLARIRVAVRNRRGRNGGQGILAVSGLEIDLPSRRISRSGKEIHLARKEFAVLEELVRFPGRVVTHRQIMAHVWPNEAEHRVDYLRVLVRSLRQKLELDPRQPQIIYNEPGVGYRLRLSAENGTAPD